MCELGERLQQEMDRCDSLLRQDKQEVEQFFHTLEMVLAGKRQAYMEALERAGAEVCQAYNPLIDRVKELQVWWSSDDIPFCLVTERISLSFFFPICTLFMGLGSV